MSATVRTEANLEVAMVALVDARQSFIDGKYVAGAGPLLAV